MTEPVLQLSTISKKDLRDIYDLYYQPLCHLAVYYLGDEDEAKGVVQDAFVKLWEISQSLNPDSNLRNFLFTLVKNGSLNILKRRQVLLKHHEKIRQMEIHFQIESLSLIHDDYLEYRELSEKIDTAVKNLPEHCRVVFEMSRFEEMKNREIAEKLGVSQKTVEAHLTKALKILRSELKDYLPLILIITEFLE